MRVPRWRKELPAQGIARTRVVLCPRLACCQSEAAGHRYRGFTRCLLVVLGRPPA